MPTSYRLQLRECGQIVSCCSAQDFQKRADVRVLGPDSETLCCSLRNVIPFDRSAPLHLYPILIPTHGLILCFDVYLVAQPLDRLDRSHTSSQWTPSPSPFRHSRAGQTRPFPPRRRNIFLLRIRLCLWGISTSLELPLLLSCYLEFLV